MSEPVLARKRRRASSAAAENVKDLCRALSFCRGGQNLLEREDTADSLERTDVPAKNMSRHPACRQAGTRQRLQKQLKY